MDGLFHYWFSDDNHYKSCCCCSSSSSASDLVPTPSNKPMNKSGYKDVKLQMIVNNPKFSKLFSVTSNILVNTAPTSVPTVEAPLNILIRVANKTASTPGGHILAANTKVGKNANSPKIANTTSSPKTKAESGIPNDLFACEISKRFIKPRGADAIVVQSRIFLIGT